MQEGLPGSIEELDEKAVEGCSIQLPLCRLLILEAVAVQESGVQEVQNPVLACRMHTLLGSICISGHNLC